VLLYAATGGFEIMPMGMEGSPGTGHGHGGVDASWLAGGALTPVSGKLA
jgi:hypothetical protein